jgi:MFS transporter, OFA family, oxalate/formate antiporter
MSSFSTNLIGFGLYYTLGVFFGELQQAFNANRAQISIISSICMGMINISGLLYGWVTDRYGPRIPVAFGGGMIFAGLLLASRATALWQLYVSVGLFVGLGIASTTIPFISMLSHWFVKRRGFTIGIQSAGAGAGMMLIAPLAQSLLTNYGWRTAFVIFSIVCLVVFSICALLIRRDPSEKGLLPYGAMEPIKDKVKPDTGAVIDEAEFSIQKLLRSADVWLIMGIKITLSLVMFMVNIHLVNFAKDAGMAATSAAMLMTIVGAVSIAGKITTGHLADRTGSRIIVIVCGAVMAGQMFWFASPLGASNLYVSAAIYGLVYSAAFPILNIIVAELFGLKQMGRVLGFMNMSTTLGSLAGPWLAGYIFDTTGSYSLAFLIAAGCAIIGVLCAIPLGKRTKQRAAEQP